MINLDYYKGEDFYSDGKVEDFILETLKSGKTLQDLPRSRITWPVYYHLSPRREKLLAWYHFRSGANLLEIGAGCGALTPMFCRKLNHVTAVELSRKRAEITDTRTTAFNNVEIIAGNLHDIAFRKKFDYITLIGVLEYAPSFTDLPEPFVAMLRTVRGLLTENGVLLVALENQFGLKYFAGAPEDHLGKCFTGLEGYGNASHVRTFGRMELEELFAEAGFSRRSFYYPMPDYKLPKIIFSDEYLPSGNEIFDVFSPNYDQDRYALFSERKVYREIIRNGQFPFFANSFLVEAAE